MENHTGYGYRQIMDLDNIPLIEAEPIQNGMLCFEFITGYVQLEGRRTPYPIEHPGNVYAYNIEDAKLLMSFIGVEWVDYTYVVSTENSGDIGGPLGEMMNRFDPKNN